MAKYLKAVSILALGLGLAFWFASRLDWQTVGAHLRNAQIWPLVLAAVLVNATLFARALRWQALLAPIAPIGLRNLFAATAVGFGAIFVIGRTGEIVRPAVLSLRERLRPTATFATILIERVFDTAAVVAAFAFNLLFLQLPGNRQSEFSAIRSLGLLLAVGVVIGIAVLVLLRLKAALFLDWLERLSSRLPKRLVQPLLNFVRHLSEGLSILLDFPALLRTVFYTMCVWGLASIAAWLTLYAFGLNYPASYIIFILGFGLVGSVVPTPGGSAGAFHAAEAKAFEFLGLEPNLAASVAIIHHLVAFGPPFLLALYFLVRDEIGFGQIRDALASEGRPETVLHGQPNPLNE